jgi:hypothetical protein
LRVERYGSAIKRNRHRLLRRAAQQHRALQGSFRKPEIMG